MDESRAPEPVRLGRAIRHAAIQLHPARSIPRRPEPIPHRATDRTGGSARPGGHCGQSHPDRRVTHLRPVDSVDRARAPGPDSGQHADRRGLEGSCADADQPGPRVLPHGHAAIPGGAAHEADHGCSFPSDVALHPGRQPVEPPE